MRLSDSPAIKRLIFDHYCVAENLFRNPKFWFILAADISLIFFALYLSCRLRFELSFGNGDNFSPYLAILPIIVLVKIPVFYFFGLYRGMWRYTSTRDLSNIVKASLVAVFLVLSVLVNINRFEGLSRSVFILDTIFTFLFISGNRVSIRYLYTHAISLNGRTSRKSTPKKRLLLIGAGDAAEKVLRELKTNPDLPYIPVGLVDDEPNKIGLRIHGIPVLGAIDFLDEHIIRTGAQEILISIAAVAKDEMTRIVGLCQQTGIPFKVIPGFDEFLDGKVSVKKIRDISYKDLLGREEVVLEQDMIGNSLKDKCVLVTGAGGSIGSELCRHIVRFSPRRLILFDCSEENLYNIEMDLLHERNLTDIVAVLGKVQDVELLNLVFTQNRPNVVFHAAAYKHVPLIESNPWQAVENNVIASQLLIASSITFMVEKFVLVSTDKAVRPTNVMGASKRLAEMLLPSSEKPGAHSTCFMAVRFGNVIGSSGSVIPLFQRQIEKGGPVTITHPDITRYFMSIEEAAQLILQAGAMGEGGEIYILKMGEPINIERMARDLIKLAGKEPGSEIELIYTRLRPGEKLYEELITEGEGIVPTWHKKIMVLRGDGKVCADRDQLLNDLFQKAKDHDAIGIKNTLQRLVPEYTPDVQAKAVVEGKRAMRFRELSN